MPSDQTVSLESVVAYLPPTAVPIADLQEQLGVNDTVLRVYRRFHGLREVRSAGSQSLVDLLHGAASKLELDGRRDQVRYLVHARTAEPSGEPSGQVLGALAKRLGLTRAVTFAVSQHACASGLLAVDTAAALLRADADPQALALVLHGEKVYPHMLRHMAPVTVLGDGTAACLLRLGAERDVLLSYVSEVHGEFHAGLTASAELLAAYQQGFTGALLSVITAALGRCGRTFDDVDLLLPGNTNRFAWTQLCKAAAFPVEKVMLENLPEVGHTFCADPFLNYVRADPARTLASGAHYVLAAVGQGGVFAAAVFRH